MLSAEILTPVCLGMVLVRAQKQIVVQEVYQDLLLKTFVRDRQSQKVNCDPGAAETSASPKVSSGTGKTLQSGLS